VAAEQISGTVLFGGTFDPIHDAHLAIAKAAMERLGVSKVLFIPAANPPHKSDVEVAPYEDRVRMAELACEGIAGFEVSRIEESAAEDPLQKSYSILTIEKLLGEGRGPLWFLIGADAFAEIRSWFRWQDVVRFVNFIVVDRPGAVYEVPEGALVRQLSGVQIPHSSSEIREKLAEGDESVPVPAAVLRYVRNRGLYRSQSLQKK
jgi:nicotinate-nucleotide adenylyltransferase